MKFTSGNRRRALEYEKDWVQRWKADRTFEKSVENRPMDNSYVFYDGPPFISGVPHHGTLLSSIVKDAIPRYQTMKGKRVERVWGWDCHGLPAERYTEKKLGIKSREEVIEYGIEKYIVACRENMVQTSSEWESTVDRIGRWVNFQGAYKTMDKIGYLQHLTTDPGTPEPLRAEAQAGLVKIEAGGPVDPVYQRIRDIHQAADDAHLHDLAEQALARVDAQTKEQKGKKKRAKKPTPAAPVVPDARYAVRAFVLTWAELDSWWLHYDLDELAAQLTDEQAEAFYATAEGTRQFATDLQAAREQESEAPRLRAL